MKMTPKTRTNLTLDAGLVAEARDLGLVLSSAAEAGIAEAIRQERAARWQAENAAALKAANDWVARDGLPLDGKRLF